MSLLDLRRRLKSVKSTQKITRAMEMVSASKMKKAQDAALAGRPYARELEKLIEGLVARSKKNLDHPYFLKRENPKKILFLLFTADRGLCGAFNSNIIRYLNTKKLDDGQEKMIVAVGRKGLQFFKHIGSSVIAEFEGLSDKPEFSQTLAITRLAVDGFLKGEFDEVRLVYNHFVNTMQQQITEKTLLPFSAPKISEQKAEKLKEVEYIFEPSGARVFERILPRFLETIVYQSLLESNASEQSARMVAMKSASENASELIGTLTLEMNKARQASITTEILEIVGGAEALAES
ncbi:MAG: ATP synthase F1 subunit gamma [Patescibacteria group bacterium]